MKRVTLAAVNAALRGEGIDAELVKANGYFYFDGPGVERAYSTSVMTNRLGTSLESWLFEARRIAAESAERAR
jgi:hypothetical protein